MHLLTSLQLLPPALPRVDEVWGLIDFIENLSAGKPTILVRGESTRPLGYRYRPFPLNWNGTTILP